MFLIKMHSGIVLPVAFGRSLSACFRGSSPNNESFISSRVWDAESNGEGPRCMR